MKVNIGAAEFDAALDNGEFPESVMEKLEEILSGMRNDPGGAAVEITLVIGNDFEPEEDEDEESKDDESEEDETEKEPSK